MAKGRRTVLPLPDGSPEPLEGGSKNELLRDGDVVLRLEASTLESVAREHELLRRLDLPEVVAPLAGPGEREDGRIASVFPSVPGTTLDRDDAGQREQLARPLAPGLVPAYADVEAFLGDPPLLTTGTVHGDVYRGNLRVRNGTTVGPIDWEEARVDWLAWELANAAWEACKVGDALDAARTDAVRCVADVPYSLTSKARGAADSRQDVDHLLRALA